MRWVVWIACGACGPHLTAREVTEDTCAGCPIGPSGPPGPAGPAGATGHLPYRWVDATGALVTESPEPMWIDPATGYVWKIDAETGEYWSGPEMPQVRWYDNASCQGSAWFESVFLPRVPFRMDGPGSTYFVRPDSVTLEPIQADAFVAAAGVCTSTAGAVFMAGVLGEFKLVSTGLVEPPPSPWVGPLRLEP